MEEATTSYGGGDRGAGGKFRKPPPPRKAPSTPYARPPPSSAVKNRPPLAVRQQQSGWISKIVDPACRLISGGATRMFPSFFSRPPPSEFPASFSDEQNHGLKEDDNIDVPRCTDDLGISVSARAAEPSKETDRSKLKSVFDDHEKKRDGSLRDDVKLHEIEHILQGKKLSREEISRLTEILHSKVYDLSNAGEKLQKVSGRSQSEGPMVAEQSLKISKKEKQEYLNEAMWRTPKPISSLSEVGASPIDLARAYMEGRSQTPDVGIIPKDDRTLPRRDESASKSSTFLPLPKPSICWPGAVVQDRGCYFTPQPQRARPGMHQFPRTPYSRSVYSKSKTKLVQSQLDGGRHFDISTPSQQLQTPIFELTKSRGRALNGSVGPIRRMRQKFVSETPRGSASLCSSRYSPSKGVNSGGFLSSVKNSVELGAANSSGKVQPLDSNLCSSEAGLTSFHPETSRLALKILEKVAKKPTPAEMKAEIDLATKSQKAAPFNLTSSMPQIDASSSYAAQVLIDPKSGQMDKDSENSPCKALHNGRTNNISGANGILGDVDLVCDRNTGSSLDSKIALGSQFNSTNQMTSMGIDSSGQRDKTHMWALHVQNNGQSSSERVSDGNANDFPNWKDKQSSHSSRSKRGLGSIFINKPNPGQAKSFNDSSGFTFPVTASGVISEPPTPSVLPSFSQSEVDHEVPSYNFGTQRSNAPLVFSFPSTSDAAAQNDASDIKFKFGSIKPRRISFKLPGNNAIYS